MEIIIHNLHPVTQQLLVFILGAATIHGFYLAILLFFKRQGQAGSLLALAVFSITLYLANYLLFLTGYILHFPHLLGLLGAAIFLVGPGFYFFIKRTLKPKSQWRILDTIHLIPFLYGCWRSIQLLQVSRERKLTYIEKLMNPESFDFSWWDFFQGTFSSFFLLGYVLVALWICKKEIRISFSDSNIKTIQWLINFCSGFVILIVADWLIKMVFFAIKIPAFSVEYILAALIAIAIHVVGYFALGGLSKILSGNGKYKTSALNEQQIQQYQKQLLNILEKEKPWIKSDLKIADLAAIMQIPSHQLSQILSEGMQTNFFDLINHYRIEEIKIRLTHPKYSHYSILAIALDCGFNNKSTFNRVFKKLTGKTPSKFVNETR